MFCEDKLICTHEKITSMASCPEMYSSCTQAKITAEALHVGANMVTIAVWHSINHLDIVKCIAVSPGTTADSSRRGSIVFIERIRCQRL